MNAILVAVAVSVLPVPRFESDSVLPAPKFRAIEQPAAEFETITMSKSDGEKLEVRFLKHAPTDMLTRLSGPTHSWPCVNGGYCGSQMCLAIHLMNAHSQTRKRLEELTFNQWRTLHDNLHNAVEADRTKPKQAELPACPTCRGGRCNLLRGLFRRR